MWSPGRGFVYLSVKEIKVMYKDIELEGDKWDEIAAILLEEAEELRIFTPSNDNNLPF